MNYQNIFNRDFYPTPNDVIERMTIGEDMTDKVILEPSAGSGNIVRWCQKNGARYVMACEINDTLRESLYNYCNVIGQDFMNVSPAQCVNADYIIMNPPFSQGEKHILHAWDVAPAGCTIIALMNHNSIAYAYGDTAKSLKEKIELFGSSENLGDVFNQGTADRRTACEIELIKLYKPGERENEFDGYIWDMTPEEIAAGGNGEEGLMQYNEVREVVMRYIDAVKRYDEVQKQSEAINESIKTFSRCHIRFGAHGEDHEGNKLYNLTRERFRKDLQRAAWDWVFVRLNMQKYTTSVLDEKINKFVEQSSAIPFTMANIYKVVNMVAQNVGNMMNECVVRAFDTICELSADNSTAGEKWRTNSNYMVNKRFIVDGMSVEIVHPYDYKDGKRVELPQHLRRVWSCYSTRYNQVNDLYKALCFVSGRSAIDFEAEVIKKCSDFGSWHKFDWFRVRFYKKGTMHFEFTDENVWYRFNQISAKEKGWKVGSRTSKGAR